MPLRSNAFMRSKPSLRGFTLIEIAICLMLVTVAVLTVILVAINGIHAQNLVRYKIIAATKAMELVELLRQHHPSMMNDSRDMDKEGIFPWDTRMCYKSMAPDMESAVECLRSTVRPLPEAIARRLDSDNDEIRSLLDQGGRIYYLYPNEPVGVLDTAPDMVRDKEWLSNANRLVVGIVGYPQQNSILYHPSVKVGAYQDFVPSPPTHGRQENSGDWTTTTRNRGTDNTGATATINYDALCRDPDIAQVLKSTNASYTDPVSGSQKYGFKPFSDFVFQSNTAKRSANMSDANFHLCRRRAQAYLVAALWYAEKAGINRNTLQDLGNKYIDPVAAGQAFADHLMSDDNYKLWKRVLAMRYVAHAGACLTSYFPNGMPPNGVGLGSAYGSGSDDANDMDMNWTDGEDPGIAPFWTKFVDGKGKKSDVPGSGFRYAIGNIRAWHEAALRMAILHADRAGPYHWGAMRPLNRQVMMDHPLVQLDIWSQPITGSFDFSTASDNYPEGYAYTASLNVPPWVVANKVVRRGWKACFPEAIQIPGIPRMFCGRHIRDSNSIDSSSDGCIDPRDAPYITADGHQDYPARMLDTNNDGVLDDLDKPVPSSTCVSTAQPCLPNRAIVGSLVGASNITQGSASIADWNAWTGVRDDLNSNGQPAVATRAHFNLTAKFSPAERCRQMVFWAVDWQSYSDFETCPSASIDASRYPIVAPHAVKGVNKNDTSIWNAGYVQRSDYQRQLNVAHACGLIIPSGRNPELVSVFRIPSLVDSSGNGSANGTSRTGRIPTVGEINTWSSRDESDYYRGATTDTGPQVPDIRGVQQCSNDPGFSNVGGFTSVGTAADAEKATIVLGHDVKLWNNMVFLGMYGVNRSGQIFELNMTCTDSTSPRYPGRGKPAAEVNVGPVPPSVRLRAITVARFNFYDPRVSGSLRY